MTPHEAPLIQSLSSRSLLHRNDDELLELIREKDAIAFETLLRRYQPLALQVAQRFLGVGAEARDVVQEVFLVLWNQEHHYEAQSSFRSYLISMVLNRCKNVRRHEKVRERKADAITEIYWERSSTQSQPEDELLQKQYRKLVDKYLPALSEDEREIVILRHMQNLSLERIASTTGRPLGTVKSHLCRGLKKLYKLCQEGLS
jgi:RNA polymerase sigma-70 factor (ECF subfamily)